MKLGLVQSAHNVMYDFLNPRFSFSLQECRALQTCQVQQNLDLLARTVGQDFDLLVTTECINYIRTSSRNNPSDASLYPPLDCAQTEALGKAARAAGSWLVAGFGYRQNEAVYNAALVFDRSGVLRAIYHKMHLAGDEGQIFSAGDGFFIQQADFGRFGVCICWDMQFPETARTLALGGAEMVVCPTWGWEADLYGRARAYENGIFTAAAMAVPAWGPITLPRTPSSAIAPDGQILACGDAQHAMLVSCCLDLSAAHQPSQTRLSGRRPEQYGALIKSTVAKCKGD